MTSRFAKAVFGAHPVDIFSFRQPPREGELAGDDGVCGDWQDTIWVKIGPQALS
jgi:hypothetical protein